MDYNRKKRAGYFTPRSLSWTRWRTPLRTSLNSEYYFIQDITSVKMTFHLFQEDFECGHRSSEGRSTWHNWSFHV